MTERAVTTTKDVDLDVVFAALISYDSNDDAKRFIEDSLGSTISQAKLEVFRRGAEMPSSPYFKPYQKRRAELAPLLEAKLAEDLLTNAQRATTAVGFCIGLATERLASGESKDPTREARDLQQVMTQAVDKRLALQGRPSAIIETRSVDELVRQLVSMKVATVDGAEEITEATVVEFEATSGD